MRIYFETLGCPKNFNDSQVAKGILETKGYEIAESPEDADVIVVNTCCVRQNAENRALGYIGSIKKLKEQKPELSAVCVP